MITSLIVGGSKGLGLAISNTFKKRGDKIIVLSRNKNDWDGDIINADLSDLKNLSGAIKKIKEDGVTLNNLVFSQKNRLQPNDLSVESNIVLQSTQYIIEQLIPHCMKNGGAVVFIGSPAARFILQEQSIEYHLCKAALEQLSKHYAVTHGKYGITFNCVLPGTVLKESNEEFYKSNPDLVNLIKEITPLKKFGSAQDVANAVSFLCSENANFITGQTILIDGGRSLEGHESLARRLIIDVKKNNVI